MDSVSSIDLGEVATVDAFAFDTDRTIIDAKWTARERCGEQSAVNS